MKQRTQRLLVASLATALFTLGGANQALALGENAGSNITNTASVAFTVGGADFTSTGSADFTVDRKIIPFVAKASACGDVYSGATIAQQIEVHYTLTNQGNSTEYFTLSLVNESGDDFDVTAIAFRDASGGPSAGNDVTTVQLTEDQVLDVYVTVEIPTGFVTADQGAFYLLATASDNTGAALAEDSNGNSVTGAAEIVFADADGDATGDGLYDGKHSGTAAAGDLCSVTVSNPALTVSKSVLSVSDPTGGTYAIPGATVTYQIVVTNNTGLAVGAVTLTDPIPAATSYVTDSVTYGGAGRSDAVDGDNVTVGGGTISVTIGGLAAGASATITFQVTIN